MIQISNSVWVGEGETVPFFGLPYSTRMTVIRLSCGSLWLHSPIRWTSQLQQQLDQLGPVKYLVAPNKLHHLFISEWQQQHPQAQIFATKALQTKRKDIRFDGLFTPNIPGPWQADIAQLLFTGSVAMEECVFFHKPSQVLIVTDLVENFSPEVFTPIQRHVAKATGILAPHGKMPIDWRLSFIFGKSEARQHLQQILSWQPKVLIMAHGLIVNHEVDKFLRRSFAWLGLT
ncbi:DUF4336 domain-containing protein [Agarivorans sp. QJM3NY_29]|uniref:DUF4336 domain-containing protein n=1 Tax=unclassified Agarivorans TaxID=2636026 RepID=UPI003D7E4BC0